MVAKTNSKRSISLDEPRGLFAVSQFVYGARNVSLVRTARFYENQILDRSFSRSDNK